MIRLPPYSPLFPYTTLFRSIYNLGDAATSRVMLLQTTITNVTGVTNFAQSTINGGLVSGLRDNTSAFGQTQPFIQTIRKDRKSTRLNSSHVRISYAVFCLKK